MKTSCASLLVRFWLLPSLLLATASAATLYWDGSATTVNSQSDTTTTTEQSWLNGGRWDNGSSSAPVASWTAGDAAVFGGTAASQTIIAGTLTIGNLTFGQGPLGAGTSGTAYSISGGTLTLSNSTITANTNTAISSVLAGSSGLVKFGAGVLTLSGANNYSGPTTVNLGTLRLGNGGSHTGLSASSTEYAIGSGASLLLDYDVVGTGSSSDYAPTWAKFKGAGTLELKTPAAAAATAVNWGDGGFARRLHRHLEVDGQRPHQWNTRQFRKRGWDCGW